MSFKIYLSILFSLFFLNNPVSLIGVFIGYDYLFPLFFLIPYVLLDTIYIISNLRILRFNLLELILLLLLLFSLIVGLYSNEFSRKVLSDFFLVIIFVFKIVIFKASILRNSLFFKIFIRRMLPYFILSGFVTVGLFIIFSKYSYIYAGLTLQLLPYFSFYLVYSSPFLLIYSIFLVLLSGKRASLISFLLIYIIYRLRKFSFFSSTIIISITIFILTFLFNFLSSDNTFVSNSTFDKYTYTFNKAKEISDISNIDIDNPALDLISAGRTSEISSVINDMKPLDYLIGKGCGYVYTNYRIANDEFAEKYSNIHFSPFNILSKYGILFFLFFYFYLFRGLFPLELKSFKSFAQLVVLGYFFESLFSFLYFVDMLFPVFIAIIQLKKNNDIQTF